MAKRKRGGGRATQNAERNNPTDFDDRAASKLNFTSYTDLADSEDEFHLNRDKIALGQEAPGAKRRRTQLQQQDDVEELSDEEVLAYPESEDEDLEGDGGVEGQEAVDASDHSLDASDAEDDKDDDDDEISGWGPSKSDYYNADNIETEQDALQEEAEARKIQQKRLKKLREEDFEFDGKAWIGSGKDGDGGGGVVTEQLPKLHIPVDMGKAERLKLLKSRYPEFEPLSKELIGLHPTYESISDELEATTGAPQKSSGREYSLLVLKHRALSSYLGALAMYFAILTSAASDDLSTATPLAPHELRDHEVMDNLVQCRETWMKVSDLVPEDLPQTQKDVTQAQESPLNGNHIEFAEEAALQKPSSKSKESVLNSESVAIARASDKRRAERRRRTEESLAALSSMQPSAAKRAKTQHPNRARSTTFSTEDPDLGDEEALGPDEAAEKARRRKSLRFYTSQIAQKANMRANASRAAGGDDDLPYRERFRDRQDRLKREAENRARKQRRDDDGANLDGESDEGETNRDREKRKQLGEGEHEEGDDDDQYKDTIMQRARAKKEDKQRRDEAYRQAGEEGGQVVYHSTNEIGPDGRREVGYAIAKNKGLTPKRKKEVKNPRVKKRKRFEDKSKKLRSMKPTYKGGEGRGGYKGELTGIKTNLVRGVKL